MNDLQDMARLAADYVNTTNRHVFLTGNAGTGKTTFLRYILQHTYKHAVVAAPTGIAAINAGGVTLHSLLQLPFGVFVPENIPLHDFTGNINMPRTLFRDRRFGGQKRKMIAELELLIIDEVSMLRADLLDCIDHTLRFLRRRKSEPFGGLQILFIGDLMQLPPVIKDHELEMIKYYYPAGGYFFEAQALQQNPPIRIELSKIYRQSDPEFIDLLNRFRYNLQTEDDLRKLNDHYLSDYEIRELEGYIHLTTHNAKADRINQERLNQLDNEPREYQAIVEGDFADNLFPTSEKLVLKRGAQVMFIKNDPTGEGRFFNGKIGEITHLDDEITVRFENGDEVDVSRYTWENNRYVLNEDSGEIEEKFLGQFSQYPIRLAWAVTIHKSQGLTFDKAILDLSGTFAPGQLYVALSRLTSLRGMVLSSPLPEKAPPIDEALAHFTKEFPQIDELKSVLSDERRNFIVHFAERIFTFNSLLSSIQDFGTDKESTETASSNPDWIRTIYQQAKELQEVGIKFIQQIRSIVTQQTYLPALQERLDKAETYFHGEFQKITKTLDEKENELAVKKRVKGKMQELHDIKSAVFRTDREISRFQLFVKGAAEDKIMTKKDQLAIEKPYAASKSSKKKSKKPTAEISFEMYKTGKTVDEVAQERGFVRSTIEGHLCNYVESGDLEAGDLISELKLDKIVKLIKGGTTNAGELKEALSNDISYSEIRIALAHAKAKSLL